MNRGWEAHLAGCAGEGLITTHGATFVFWGSLESAGPLLDSSVNGEPVLFRGPVVQRDGSVEHGERLVTIIRIEQGIVQDAYRFDCTLRVADRSESNVYGGSSLSVSMHDRVAS